MTESEGTGVQPYIRESNALKGGRSSNVTEFRTEPRDRGTERISCYEQRKLISQVRRPHRPQQLRCWEKMKTHVHSYIQTQCMGLLARH